MTRVRSWTFWIAGGVAVYLMLCLLGMAARADAVTVAGDLPAVQVATSTGWDALVHQGPLFGGLLLASALYREFLKRNESAHWIAQGKALAVMTGLGMVIGAAADWKFNGGAAAGVVAALFTAVSLAMHSTVKSSGGAA